jgi:hypothetical protein
MANSVFSYVTVNFLEEAQAKQFFNTINPDGKLDSIIDQHIIPGLENTREAWIDAVGAKWCFVQDADAWDTQVTLHLESAWIFPEELMYTIAVLARKQEGFIDIRATWQDEGYNEIGAFGVDADNEVAIHERVWDELRNGFCEENDLDSEDEDLDIMESHWEEFQEYIDEVMETLQEAVDADLSKE